MQGQIVVDGLTKVYPKVRAVDGLSFAVEPGRVTGFLGPNGSGKTTTLRMMLNLVTPTSGNATIGGQRYADLVDPLGTVGAILEASRRTSTSRPGLGRATKRRPRTCAVPVVGGVRPTMTRIVVDFPAPLGPRNPVTRPGSAAKVTSSTAV